MLSSDGRHVYPPEPTAPKVEKVIGKLIKATPAATARSMLATARGYTPEALKRIWTLMMDPDTPPAVALRACETLLDRGWGKAPQALLIKDDTEAGPVSGVLGLTILERIAAIKAAQSAAPEPAIDLEASAQRLIEPPDPTQPIVDDEEDII